MIIHIFFLNFACCEWFAVRSDYQAFQKKFVMIIANIEAFFVVGLIKYISRNKTLKNTFSDHIHKLHHSYIKFILHHMFNQSFCPLHFASWIISTTGWESFSIENVCNLLEGISSDSQLENFFHNWFFFWVNFNISFSDIFIAKWCMKGDFSLFFHHCGHTTHNTLSKIGNFFSRHRKKNSHSEKFIFCIDCLLGDDFCEFSFSDRPFYRSFVNFIARKSVNCPNNNSISSSFINKPHHFVKEGASWFFRRFLFFVFCDDFVRLTEIFQIFARPSFLIFDGSFLTFRIIG